MEDQGEATYLCGQDHDPYRENLSVLYANCRSEFMYRGDMNPTFFQYRNHGGALVPLAVKSKAGTLGLIYTMTESPTKSDILSADSFLRAYPKSRVLITHNHVHAEVLHSRLAVVPMGMII